MGDFLTKSSNFNLYLDLYLDGYVLIDFFLNHVDLVPSRS